MALTIALKPELEAQLRAEAAQQGQSLEVFLQHLLSQAVGRSGTETGLLADALPEELYSSVAGLDDAGVLAISTTQVRYGTKSTFGGITNYGQGSRINAVRAI
jgi:hypothetical protein